MASPSTPGQEANGQPLHQFNSTPKNLTVESSWDDILSELYRIQARIIELGSPEYDIKSS